MKALNSTYRLFALSTAHRTAVLTLKESPLLVLDDALVITKWTFLQVLKTCSFDFFELLHAIIQVKKCGCKESVQLGLRKEKVATGPIHTNDVMIVLAQEVRCI
jgi:hypothetical protein